MSAGESGMSPAAVRVKEEQELDDYKIEIEIDCAASEAAAASSYAEHEVKRELVLGPERLQPAESNISMPAAVRVKDEQDWDAAGECGASEAAAAGLYVGHEVKNELVLGPERLQLQDIAYAIPQSLLGAERCLVKQEPAGAGPGHAPRSGDSRGEQLALRTCLVSLQRLPLNDELHECTSCRRTFLHECTLRTHSAEETSSNITKSQQVFNVSEEEQSYSCDSCGKGFTLKTSLIQHVLIYTGEKPLCGICKKQSSKCSTFATHKTKFHTGETPCSCKLCLKQLSDSSYLTSRKLIHTREKPFTCNVCKKQFSSQSKLASHERIHTGEKPYFCDICKKCFTHSSSLTNHKRIHTMEKPFLCIICSKRFSRNSTLIMHKRIHTGEKPYSCDICERQFTHSCDLDRHKRIHTREKPFLCNICNKQFSLKSSLVRHNLVHTGTKSFTCNFCKKHFKQRAHLVRHELIHSIDSSKRKHK